MRFRCGVRTFDRTWRGSRGARSAAARPHRRRVAARGRGRDDRAGRLRGGAGRRAHRGRRPSVGRWTRAADGRLHGSPGTGVGPLGGYLHGMKLDIIAQIVQILKDAPEVGAIEIRRGLFGAWSSVRVSKAGHGGNTIGGGGPGGAHVIVSHPAAAPAAASTSTAPSAPAGPQLLEIKSPMVGTFYQSPEPAAQPYVKVGSRVNVGQVVCIIEAMKIMNEIESEVAGVIREVSAQTAQPVEFGQVLFRVDPHG